MPEATNPLHALAHPPALTAGAIALLSNVSKTYAAGATAVHALRNVTLVLPRGEVIVLLGPSGSGKTTLLNLVGGIESATSGEVWVDGTHVDKLDSKALNRFRREKIGFVFQFFNLIPTLTALENVELAARLVGNPLDAGRVLDSVGLGDRRDHYPGQLSGGEQQRVAIARALVRRPPLLLCDEPTGELDADTGRRVLTLLRELNRTHGITVLLVTHNTAIAQMSDRVVRMHSGQVASVEANLSPMPPNQLRW